MAKNKTITLTKAEIKLLIYVLKDAEDMRSDMGCDDAIYKEEKLFSKKDRIKIQKDYLNDEWGLEEDEMDGHICSSDFPRYLEKRIKEQLK